MVRFDGGEDDLAPVIPLFGDASEHSRLGVRETAPPEHGDVDGADAHSVVHARGIGTKPADPGKRRTERLLPAELDADRSSTSRDADGGAVWDIGWIAEPVATSSPDETVAAGEAALLRKLRVRQLSVSEAVGVLRDQGLSAAEAETVVDRCRRLGYLDDAALAAQLAQAAVTRKGHGRRAIGLALSKRGIDRDTADATVRELPDDDDERAREYARAQARRMSRLDRETAVRRLAGQLARRGYSGSVALSAAREAVDARD